MKKTYLVDGYNLTMSEAGKRFFQKKDKEAQRYALYALLKPLSQSDPDIEEIVVFWDSRQTKTSEAEQMSPGISFIYSGHADAEIRKWVDKTRKSDRQNIVLVSDDSYLRSETFGVGHWRTDEFVGQFR